MVKTICAHSPFNSDTEDFEIEFPKTCPYCGQGIQPLNLSNYYLSGIHGNNLFSMFCCPVCESVFMAFYKSLTPWKTDSALPVQKLYPQTQISISFSENIKKLSPDFVNTYNQSYQAEQAGLDKICGMGYRKALEFLIKDYAIHTNPGEDDEIKTMRLGNCINTYIDNTKIKSLAKGATWIGNDETHYQRRNEDYGLNDMKSFIAAAVAFIDCEFEVENANNLINSKNQP